MVGWRGGRGKPPPLNTPLQPLLSIRSLPCFQQPFNRANSSSSTTLNSFCRLHVTDSDSFLDDRKPSSLITKPPKSLGFTLIAYNTTLLSLLDKDAPVVTKLSKCKSKSYPWFNPTLHTFKSTVHHAEDLWKQNHSALDWSSFICLCSQYHTLIVTSKNSICST